MNFTKSYLIIVFSIFLLSFQSSTEKYATNWPNWRGPNSDGVSLNGTPPTEWSETKNIKWKTPIPGLGLGTPIIWENQIFITTAIELDQKGSEEAIKRLKKTSPTYVKILGMAGITENIMQFIVYSIDKNTGEIIWEQVVREQYPHEGINDQGSWASASCVTDGKHLIASFGSYGIYCFDMTGNLIWEKDLGDMQVESAFGEGTSPVLYKGKVVVVWDHEGQSKIYALNKNTGEIIWEKERVEATTWATPVIIDVNGQAQIVVPGEINSIGYGLEKGNEIWHISGLGGGIIPSPVFDGEMIYLMTGFGKLKIVQAINVQNAKGSLENSGALKWTIEKNSSYVPSPMLKDGKLYYLRSSNSQLNCVDSKTGKVYYEMQRPSGMGGAYASPMWANGHIYMMDRRGLCSVIKDGEIFEVVSQNRLDDRFDASPAVVGNDLFLRGHKSLYCISE